MIITVKLDLEDREDLLKYEYINAQPQIHSFFDSYISALQEIRKKIEFEGSAAYELANDIIKKFDNLFNINNIFPLIEEQRALYKELCSCKKDELCGACDRWQTYKGRGAPNRRTIDAILEAAKSGVKKEGGPL